MADSHLEQICWSKKHPECPSTMAKVSAQAGDMAAFGNIADEE